MFLYLLCFLRPNQNSKSKILINFNRQALHAKSLGLFHPTKNKLMNFDSKLPQDFKKMLDFLENFDN